MSNGNQSIIRGIELSERLVHTVARAFYTDTVAVMLDALVHDKYLCEKEIPIRLKLREKEVSRALSHLQRERLVAVEDIDGTKHYYLDYQSFVNVIRLRIHLMQRSIKENAQRNINFKCPSCRTVFGVQDVLLLKSRDHKFICSYCSPVPDLRSIDAEPAFTLIGADVENDFRAIERKMNRQLSKSKPGEYLHDGIFELLQELKSCQLIHNRPSDNKARGIGPGAVSDVDIKLALEELYRKETTCDAKRARVEESMPNTVVEVETKADELMIQPVIRPPQDSALVEEDVFDEDDNIVWEDA